jgi:hypothetical protein
MRSAARARTASKKDFVMPPVTITPGSDVTEDLRLKKEHEQRQQEKLENLAPGLEQDGLSVTNPLEVTGSALVGAPSPSPSLDDYIDGAKDLAQQFAIALMQGVAVYVTPAAAGYYGVGPSGIVSDLEKAKPVPTPTRAEAADILTTMAIVVIPELIPEVIVGRGVRVGNAGSALSARMRALLSDLLEGKDVVVGWRSAAATS